MEKNVDQVLFLYYYFSDALAILYYYYISILNV